jgi:hypothetical protein
MENDLYLGLHKEPLTYHRGGQWFKSSTAHHPTPTRFSILLAFYCIQAQDVLFCSAFSPSRAYREISSLA